MPHELPALLKAIEDIAGRWLLGSQRRLMALTFVRTSELIGARWPEFDSEARRWNIPAERMKMKTPAYRSALNSERVEVLELLRIITGGGELLFPGDIDHRKPDEQQHDSLRAGAYRVQRRDDWPRV